MADDARIGYVPTRVWGCPTTAKQQEGFKAAVQWRDSGKPIPEGDEARELVRKMDKEAKRKSGA